MTLYKNSESITADTLISVIVPVFNQARFIGQALDSVFGQGDFNLQVIVVDDGSEDDIDRHLKPYMDRIQFYRQTNRGAAAAKNAGLGWATGDLIAMVDADDYWLPGKLRLQMDVLNQRPDIQIVFGHCREFYDEELSEAERATLRCSQEPRISELPSIMLARISVYDLVGHYDESYVLGMDMDWSLRCRSLGIATYVLPQTIYARRIHRNNSGRVYRQFRNDRVHALKAHLDRVRKRAEA